MVRRDVLVADELLVDDVRSALVDDRPEFPNPGCTTVSVYPHESGQPSSLRRLVKRLTFN